MTALKRIIMGTMFAVLLMGSLAAKAWYVDEKDTYTIGVSLTGSWHNPQHPGQGYFVQFYVDEVSRRDKLFICWYTYDNDGKLTWFSAGGDVQGKSSTLPLYIVKGGKFLDTKGENVQIGTLTIRLTGGKTGDISFNITDNSEANLPVSSANFPVEMLTTVPGNPTSVNATQRAGYRIQGAWFNPAFAHQGLNAQYYTDPATQKDAAFVSWFTFDNEGKRLWLTAQGLLQNADSNLLTLYATTQGGFLGAGADNRAIGTLTFNTSDGKNGSVDIKITDSDYTRIQSDSFFQIQRLTPTVFAMPGNVNYYRSSYDWSYTKIVPEGVYKIYIQGESGDGGDGGYNCSINSTNRGYYGSEVNSSYRVFPGDVLRIETEGGERGDCSYNYDGGDGGDLSVRGNSFSYYVSGGRGGRGNTSYFCPTGKTQYQCGEHGEGSTVKISWPNNYVPR